MVSNVYTKLKELLKKMVWDLINFLSDSIPQECRIKCNDN